jgi:hypothetical protein
MENGRTFLRTLDVTRKKRERSSKRRNLDIEEKAAGPRKRRVALRYKLVRG